MAASPASIASISLAADNVDDVDTASNVAMKFLEMALVR
jgi:histidine ammonia-lyase